MAVFTITCTSAGPFSLRIKRTSTLPKRAAQPPRWRWVCCRFFYIFTVNKTYYNSGYINKPLLNGFKEKETSRTNESNVHSALEIWPFQTVNFQWRCISLPYSVVTVFPPPAQGRHSLQTLLSTYPWAARLWCFQRNIRRNRCRRFRLNQTPIISKKHMNSRNQLVPLAKLLCVSEY